LIDDDCVIKWFDEKNNLIRKYEGPIKDNIEGLGIMVFYKENLVL
jgi:hypothetical protein